jgi:hypothetical protein
MLTCEIPKTQFLNKYFLYIYTWGYNKGISQMWPINCYSNSYFSQPNYADTARYYDMQNLYTMQTMYPYNQMTFFGGRPQAFLAPDTMTPQQAFWAQQTNMGIPTDFGLGVTPQRIAQGNAYIASCAEKGIQFSNNWDMGKLTPELAGTKSRLQAVVDEEAVSASDKVEAENLIEQIKSMEAHLKKIAEKQGERPASEIREGIESVKGALLEVKKAAEKLAKSALEAAQAAQNQTLPATTEAGNAEAESAEAEGEEEAGSADVGSTVGRQEQATKMTEIELGEYCAAFYGATNGPGTDDPTFEQLLGKINADNIIEIIQYWDKCWKGIAGNDFINQFIGDSGDTQQKTYGQVILEALRKKATALDVDVSKECADVSAVLTNNCAFAFQWIKDDKLYATLNALYEKIQKAENLARQNQETVDKFSADLEEDFKKRGVDTTKIKTDVNKVIKCELDEDGKVVFEIQHNNKTYRGYTYDELIQAVKKDDPSFKLEKLLRKVSDSS